MCLYYHNSVSEHEYVCFHFLYTREKTSSASRVKFKRIHCHFGLSRKLVGFLWIHSLYLAPLINSVLNLKLKEYPKF